MLCWTQQLAEPREVASVLFFSFDYPPLDGGISRLSAELVTGLQREGVEIRVLSQYRNEMRSCMPPAPEDRVTMRRPLRELAALWKLRHWCYGKVVICGVWYPEGLLATLAGVRPIVILAHGFELWPRPQLWRRGAWRWLMQRVLGRSRIVVANSRYTADLVRTRAPGANVAAVPLGVDHRRFCPGDRQAARRRLGVPGDKRVIVTVSRIESYKGHSLVFRALAAMPEDIRANLIYLIAGQGRDMEPLAQAADTLGLADVVRWLGYVPEVDLPDLYRSADLFLLCTRENRGQAEVEGFGLAFLEAQACGIPVVGTRTGGIPDAVQEGRGGWLIEQDDAGALAAILAYLVEVPAEFERMGRIARQRVEEECTWDHYIDRFIQVLRVRGVSIT
jgi:phosphatidylinositol alpha-1,6-mannosyltransferase